MLSHNMTWIGVIYKLIIKPFANIRNNILIPNTNQAEYFKQPN